MATKKTKHPTNHAKVLKLLGVSVNALADADHALQLLDREHRLRDIADLDDIATQIVEAMDAVWMTIADYTEKNQLRPVITVAR